MKHSHLDKRLALTVSHLDAAKVGQHAWLIQKLAGLARSETVEGIRMLYLDLIQQAQWNATLDIRPRLATLNETEKKALHLDLKRVLSAWRNTKSLNDRKKLQVNIQISEEAKEALKRLAKAQRISQGEVVEALLKKQKRKRPRSRSFERADNPRLDE